MGNSKDLILPICSKIKGKEKLSGIWHCPEARKVDGGKGCAYLVEEKGYHIVSCIENLP